MTRVARIVLAAAAATAVTLAGLPAAAAPTNGDGAVVVTDTGAVRGVVTAGNRGFQGIPYAAPPVGPLRWRAPRPADSWTGVRDATKPGSACAQGEHPIGRPSTIEDCLYLNVTTTRRTATTRRSVLVWIHGGSFLHGAADQYDAARLASRGDVVVVSMNYRLGAFGFLAHPALDDGRNLSGNFGLQDQQAALRWVRRNVAAFGGDPCSVTLIGESAGGYSVCNHLVSPTAKHLFHRAIIHSAGCATRWSPESYAAPRQRRTAERYGADLARRLGCQTAGCLRDLPSDRIVAETREGDFGPVLGGSPLPLHPADALATGRFNRVPVLYGSNHDEEDGRIGAPEAITGVPLSQAAVEQQVRADYGRAAERVLEQYPSSAYASPAEALATLLTDDLWSRPAYDTHRLLARHLPTYSFEFAGHAPWYAGLGQPSFTTGTHHISELGYLFDLWLLEPLDQKRLADQVIGYWVRFARTGNPNHPGAPGWLPFRTGHYVQSLSPAGIGRTDLRRDHRYDFWTALDR